ncbi:MAG: hypothetical protein JW910_22880 [Anaerolineae bacterium]|nr:hypothetical protein [Anaerolineae bacterium]
MENLMLTLGVALMFLLRIGVPVLVLIGLGILIDRWQSKKESEFEQLYRQHDELVAAQEAGKLDAAANTVPEHGNGG